MQFLKKLFGQKEKKKNEEKNEKKKSDFLFKNNPQSFVCDSIIQYVSSPIFYNELEDFKELNCLIFNDEEESSHQQYLVFKQYTSLIERKLEEMIGIIGITADEFCQAAFLCYSDPKFRKIVEELFFIDDFLCFKRMMKNKNMQIEFELEKQSGKIPKTNAYLMEKKELELAIEVSKKMYEDYINELNQEEFMMQEAIRLSKETYEKENQLLKESLLESERIRQKISAENSITKPSLKTSYDTADENLQMMEFRAQENLKRKQEIKQKLDLEKQEIDNRLKKLMSINENYQMQYNNNENMLFNGHINLGLLAHECKEESIEERKERLLKQREALLKTRKEKRDNQIKETSVMTPIDINKKEHQIENEKLKHKQIYEELIKEKVI